MQAIMLMMILFLAAVEAAPPARTRNRRQDLPLGGQRYPRSADRRNGNDRAAPSRQADGENPSHRGTDSRQGGADDGSSKCVTERTNSGSPGASGSAGRGQIDAHTLADKVYQFLQVIYKAKTLAWEKDLYQRDRLTLPPVPIETASPLTSQIVSTTPWFAAMTMITEVDPWMQWLQVWRKSQEGCGVPHPEPSSVPEPRVAGGRTAQRGSWPWMVSLSPKPMNGQHFCGGVLLSTSWVLTSAHCLSAIPFLWGENKWLVRLGKLVQDGPGREQTEQDYNVSKIVLHPDFDVRMVRPAESQGRPSDHDLALVKLSGEANVTQWVRPICLPEAGFQPEHGKTCVVTGWGFTQDPTSNAGQAHGIRLPRYLQQGIVPIWDYKDCKKLEGYSDLLTPNMLCAGDEDGTVDTCKFDSGGPLQCRYNERWFAIGVTSWGDAGGEGCAKPMKPGVYTAVGAHVTWILQTMYAD